MNSHEVLIAGGGPTGLMLAVELALAGVDVAIVERRASQALAGSRAGGLHARTIEVLDQRGIADRFLAEGQVAQRCGFASIKLDISDFPSRHAYTLGLWQNRIEQLLAGWVEGLGVRFHREREVTGFVQDETGVTLAASGGLSLRAGYLVGCDGGRSLVRKLAGIAFPGWDATASHLIAEVEMTQEPPLGIHRTARGLHSFGRLDYEIRDGEIVYKDGGPIRVMVPEAQVGAAGEPTLQDLRDALVAVCGTDYGVHAPTWLSRFTDAARQAAAYRDRRVLLAGDAAHVHSPVGGQGLNTGVQDAVNLGWKLAQVVKGISPESLLDTYHAERHPVGARVLRHAMAGAALLREDDHSGALRDTLAELLVMDGPRRRLAAELSGLGLRYDLGDGHPLLGRRMPDLDLVTADGPRRVFSLLHDGRAVLLDLGDARAVLDTGALWSTRVRCLHAQYRGPWELPELGAVEAPAGVLVRPDGHVAWVGEGTAEGLAEALHRWCGTPAT
jgi:2-polyprenyl-6-methoxyphenol hydroxylase-like FAD-dependent oxidoreductase